MIVCCWYYSVIYCHCWLLLVITVIYLLPRLIVRSFYVVDFIYLTSYLLVWWKFVVVDLCCCYIVILPIVVLTYTLGILFPLLFRTILPPFVTFDPVLHLI